MEQEEFSKEDVIDVLKNVFFCSYEQGDDTLTIDGTFIHIKVFEEEI